MRVLRSEEWGAFAGRGGVVRQPVAPRTVYSYCSFNSKVIEMKIWLVKCRKYLPHREGWSWDQYFDRRDRWYSRDCLWGSHKWIRSPQSQMFIREEVEKHNLIVCYQSEGRRLCGFSRMAGDGLEEEEGSGEFNQLHLASRSWSLAIEPELNVDQLRATGCDPVWLRKGQGTVFPLTQNEFKGIVRAVRIWCPGIDDRLANWLRRVGFDTAAVPSIEKRPRRKLKNAGAGFSTDTERNAQVEQAAVRIVKRSFTKDGWEVEDVQADCLGFDLVCRNGAKRVDVEVKGASGSQPSFPITYGEVHQAKTNKNFAIHVVTEALSKHHRITKMSGRRFIRSYDLKPIGFIARPKV